MNRPGIEPRSFGPLVNTLIIMPMGSISNRDYSFFSLLPLTKWDYYRYIVTKMLCNEEKAKKKKIVPKELNSLISRKSH